MIAFLKAALAQRLSAAFLACLLPQILTFEASAQAVATSRIEAKNLDRTALINPAEAKNVTVRYTFQDKDRQFSRGGDSVDGLNGESFVLVPVDVTKATAPLKDLCLDLTVSSQGRQKSTLLGMSIENQTISVALPLPPQNVSCCCCRRGLFRRR